MQKQEVEQQSWWLRFVKGMFVGSGFIVPGVSGGALSAIFGIYQPLINFLANITENFMKNIKFFLPVGIGAVVSIFLLSFGVTFALDNYATIVLWFFVGTIVGMIPSLWADTGKEGRGQTEWIILITSFIFGLLILSLGSTQFGGGVDGNFWTFLLCGVLISLGLLIPGLSPSNFIVYLGLYGDMTRGISNLDFGVIIPIILGAIVTIFSLAKLIEYIFDNYYSKFYHFIFGVVLASTIMIIPTDYAGFGWIQYLWCAIMLIGGVALGAWMTRLESKYK